MGDKFREREEIKGFGERKRGGIGICLWVLSFGILGFI